MRKFAFLVSIALITPAFSESQTVTGDALRQLASGKTVHLESPYGTLPVTFKEDGTLSAKASGALAVYLGAATDRGRWAIEGDRICQKFFKWFHAETHCMRVKQDGRRITWRRDDGLTGNATVAANTAPLPGRPVGLGVRPAEMAPSTAMPEPAAVTLETTAAPISVSSANEAPEASKKQISAALARAAPYVTVAAEPAEPLAPKLLAAPALARRPLADDNAQQAASAPLAMVAATAMTMREAVAEVAAQRASYLWCEQGLASVELGGISWPWLFDAPRGEVAQEAPDRQSAGCFMPTAILSDIARKMAAKR